MNPKLSSPNPYLQAVIRATDFLSKELLAKASAEPGIAVILGSGLGEFAETLNERETIPFSAVPHSRRRPLRDMPVMLCSGESAAPACSVFREECITMKGMT